MIWIFEPCGFTHKIKYLRISLNIYVISVVSYFYSLGEPWADTTSHAGKMIMIIFTLLDIWIFDEKEQPVIPWLTVIMDDYSRVMPTARLIAGYYISL